MYRMEGGRVREAADVLNRVACLQEKGTSDSGLSSLSRNTQSGSGKSLKGSRAAAFFETLLIEKTLILETFF